MSDWALQALGVSLRWGQQQVLQGVNLNIAQGQWTCLVGPNGAGKSTLLKALAGLQSVQGQLMCMGQPLSAMPRRQRAQTLAWLGQGQPAQGDLTVWDTVMLGRLPYLHGLASPSARDHAAVQTALMSVHAGDWSARRLGELSGGERQRVLLARAMATEAPIVLMDEPLTALDPPHQVDWLEQVQCLKALGRTVVSVLHELNMAMHADRMVVMSGGQVVHEGGSQEPETHRAVEEVFDKRIRSIKLDGQVLFVPQR